MKKSDEATAEIQRLEKLKAKWEKFESPEETKRRHMRQALILGEAMLRVRNTSVPAGWHDLMLEVASEHLPSESEQAQRKESADEQSKDEKWLVIRERLEADGWRFGKDSEGSDVLFLPPKH